MRLQINPEPSDSERRAIESAVFAYVRKAGPKRANWWAVGVEENLADGALDEGSLDGDAPTRE